MCCWRRRTSEGRKESAALCFADLGAAAASRLLCCTQTTAGVVETEMMMCLWVSVDSGCRHGLLKKSMIFKLLFVSVWLFLFFTDFPWSLGHFGSSQYEKTPCLCTLFSWTAVWMDLKMIKELHSVFVYISHSIPPLWESGLSPIFEKTQIFTWIWSRSIQTFEFFLFEEDWWVNSHQAALLMKSGQIMGPTKDREVTKTLSVWLLNICALNATLKVRYVRIGQVLNSNCDLSLLLASQLC